ncbi:MAG: 30S ribosomal protein S2 [Bacteroidales bacterium]|jgi:small subunit ribosomal protein S2|nr:30S ribosomal protein S2 [Bacteroidales bacterium]NLM92295.1 30S ribosomal protein S2 [Bacteroidales bacterium]
MARTNYNELLDAGVHFGHLKRKWNPNMAPYIFMERNGIHIIDLNKTIAKIDEAAAAMKQIAKSGKKILFVATKKQAKDVVANLVKQVNMPYVTERWPGGMLTNFATIRKAVKKMATIDRMETDGTFENMSKRERLQVTRERAKLEKQLGSISDLNRLPAAVFVVDICKEHIAVAESRKLNIPTFAIVDTNANPNEIDFPIPANDDASKSIHIILKLMIEAIQEGMEERKLEKDKAVEEEEDTDMDLELDSQDKDAESSEEDEEEVALRKAKAAKKAKHGEEDEEVKSPKAPKGAPQKKPQGKRPRL